MSNVIKTDQINSNVNRKLELSAFYKSIQPELHSISKACEQYDISSFVPCIDNNGHIYANVEDYTLETEKNGQAVIFTRTVLTMPFPEAH